eukprot:2698746-Amphidinium_carterae.1
MDEGFTVVQLVEALKSAGFDCLNFDTPGLVASLRLELDEGAGRELLGTLGLGQETLGALTQSVETAEVEAACQHKRPHFLL